MDQVYQDFGRPPEGVSANTIPSFLGCHHFPLHAPFCECLVLTCWKMHLLFVGVIVLCGYAYVHHCMHTGCECVRVWI